MDLQPSVVPQAKAAIRMVYSGSRGGIPQCRQLAPCQHLHNCLCESCRMFCIFYNAVFCTLQRSFINRRQVVALHCIELRRVASGRVASRRAAPCRVASRRVRRVASRRIASHRIASYRIVLAVRSLAVASQPRQS